MAKKSVFCLARDEAQATRIVDDLKSAGFSNNDISVLLPDKGSTREFASSAGFCPPRIGAGSGSKGGPEGAAFSCTRGSHGNVQESWI